MSESEEKHLGLGVKQLICGSLNGMNGEGHGNPLQCSCLENSVDKGAWWAAAHRVAQSQTGLKQFSGSSSKWNENLTVLATAIHRTGRNAGLLEEAVARSWSLGIVEQSQGEDCC